MADEDKTGEDVFGPFIAEHNEKIRCDERNKLLNILEEYIEGDCYFSSDELKDFITEVKRNGNSRK